MADRTTDPDIDVTDARPGTRVSVIHSGRAADLEAAALPL